MSLDDTKEAKKKTYEGKKILGAFFVLLLIALIAGFLIYKFFYKKTDSITLFGNIEIRQADLAFRVTGRIIRLYHEEGDYVRKGDLLAQLDDDTYKTQVMQALADLKDASAAYTYANQVYERNIELCRDSTVSKIQCEDYVSSKNQAQARVKLAAAKLDEAKINLEDTKLFAPNNGIILTRILEKGTIVSQSMPVYSLSLTEPVWVRAYIPESYLGRIKLGQKAYVYSDSRPDYKYKATVGFISPVAEFTPKTVETLSLRTDLVYRLRIIIDKTDEYLRQGMPVSVDIPFDSDLKETKCAK